MQRAPPAVARVVILQIISVLLCRIARVSRCIAIGSGRDDRRHRSVAFSVARASYFTRHLQFAPEAVLMRNASYFFLASPIGHIAWLRPTE
jgi:hypothetical protein